MKVEVVRSLLLAAKKIVTASNLNARLVRVMHIQISSDE